MGLLIAARAAVKNNQLIEFPFFIFEFRLSLSKRQLRPNDVLEWRKRLPREPKRVPGNSQRQASARGAKGGNAARDGRSQGETIATRVHEIKDKTVVVDLNHPLGGKDST